MYRTLFQWTGNGFTAFRIVFSGKGGTATIYTDGVHLDCAGTGAGCWEAGEKAWSFIAGSNAGDTATVTVDALDTSGGTPVARRSAAITIGFSKKDVKGAIFYWSTTAKGIRRGSLAAAQPEDYLTGQPGTTYPDGDTVGCVACHTVSRDGKYLLAPAASKKPKNLWVLEVTAEPAPKPVLQDLPDTDGHGFATISPDDEKIVVAWKGLMWQLDRVTGNKTGDLDLGALTGTQPDWSPDNTQLVFATGAGDAPSKASLAVTSYGSGTSWGAPKILVPAAGKTNLFPQFSPDGKWIAYSRGDKGGHDDLSMHLHLVRAELGSTPIPLVRASCAVSTRTDVCKTENYEPTWAPTGDLQWVAFNSRRQYGVVLKSGEHSQLWVAAIDTSGSGDPSYPAFRVPFQGLDEDNHRAFWTHDIREPEEQPDAGVPLPDAAVPPDGTEAPDAAPAPDAPQSPDAGVPDAPQPEPDARECVEELGSCDPIFDTCCSPDYVCDSNDDGETYLCIHASIP